MQQYEAVAYTPHSPRDWMRHSNAGFWDNCRRVADQLLGPGALAHGVGPAAHLVGRTPAQVGISVFGPVVLVVWSGFPADFAWNRLDEHGRLDRFYVASYPASSSADFLWEAADGTVRRHVSIDSQGVATNTGEASLYPARRDTSNPNNWNIGRPGQDPLRGKLGGDPESLADRVTRHWFDFSMLEETDFPPVAAFTLPDEPELLGLSQAMAAVQRDRATFFSLLAEASSTTVAERIGRQFSLGDEDVRLLLKQPIERIFQ